MTSHSPFPGLIYHPAHIPHLRTVCSSAALPFPVPAHLYQTYCFHSSRPRAVSHMPQLLTLPNCPSRLPSPSSGMVEVCLFVGSDNCVERMSLRGDDTMRTNTAQESSLEEVGLQRGLEGNVGLELWR